MGKLIRWDRKVPTPGGRFCASYQKNPCKDMEEQNNKNSTSIHSGDFGESFIAYLLAKKGIHVVRASTVGFDLFAIDKIGNLLPKDKLVGISAKARISEAHVKFVPTIPVGSTQIESSSKIWNAEPYLGVVIGSKDNQLTAFLVPLKDLPQLRGRATREDIVAVSELYKNSFGNVIRLF